MRTTLHRDNLLLREFTITGSTVATDKKKKKVKILSSAIIRLIGKTNKQTNTD